MEKEIEIGDEKLIKHRIPGLNFFSKDWGWEHWFANTDKYCGKIIYIQYNLYSSRGNYHYHKIKDETFYVSDGILTLDFCNYDDNYEQIQSISLHAGQSIRIKPYIRHRFGGRSKQGCLFIEASTHHEETDSYRCRWNKIDESWVDYDPNSEQK